MENKIKEIMEKVLQTNITEDITMKDNQYWDSIANINLIVELEQEFNINFEPDEIEKMKSYNEIVGIIKNKINNGDEV